MSFNILPYAPPWALHKAKAFLPEPLLSELSPSESWGEVKTPVCQMTILPPQSPPKLAVAVDSFDFEGCWSLRNNDPKSFSFSQFFFLILLTSNKSNCSRGNTKSLVNHHLLAHKDSQENILCVSYAQTSKVCMHSHFYRCLQTIWGNFSLDLLRALPFLGPWISVRP